MTHDGVGAKKSFKDVVLRVYDSAIFSILNYANRNNKDKMCVDKDHVYNSCYLRKDGVEVHYLREFR